MPSAPQSCTVLAPQPQSRCLLCQPLPCLFILQDMTEQLYLLEKSLPRSSLALMDKMCVLPQTHHTCPCLSHNTQHFRHFLFPSAEVSPLQGCEHLDDQDCGCLIPTVHCLHRPLSTNSPHALNCIRPSLKLQKSLEPRGY